MRSLRLVRALATAVALPLSAGLSGCAATTAEMRSHPRAMLTSAAAASPARGSAECGQVQAYTLGSSVSGEWSVTDCQTDDNRPPRPIDVYRITTPEVRDLTLVLDAPGMTADLVLVTADGSPVKEVFANEFGHLTTQVAPGTYLVQLRVNLSASTRRTGRYTLHSSSDQTGFEGCPTLPELAPGGSVDGTWSVTDCRSLRTTMWVTRLADHYLLRVPVEREVEVALDAPGVMPSLSISTRDGVVLKNAWDPGATGSVQIQTPLAPGEYVITVRPHDQSRKETGRYTLRVDSERGTSQ